MEISKLIQSILAEHVQKLYDFTVSPEEMFIEHPDNKSWGDYACNVALQLSKQLKQSPMQIAEKLCYELNNNGPQFEVDGNKYYIFEEASFARPGFINIKLSLKWLLNVLLEIQHSTRGYGSSLLDIEKRVALEHSNVNPNKAAHVGHLRNACLGQFIERVYEYLGYQVEVQYYANDVGLQVATSTLGMDLIKDISEGDYDKFDHYAWDIYSKISALIEENPEFGKLRDDLMIKLEDPTSPESIKQREIADKVLIDQLKTFQSLDFDYDVVIHERDILYLGFWEKTFSQLTSNEKVYKSKSGPSEGCWLVKFNENTSASGDSNNGIEQDKILVRSNGVPTYTGKDIAYHMWKFGVLGMDFYYKKMNTSTQTKPLWETSSDKPANETNLSFSNVDVVIDVIDGKQAYAMESVRKSLSYLGYEKQSNNMTHVNYGFVYLSPATAESMGIDISDGKSMYAMSGRKGWGIKVDDFVNQVGTKLIETYGDSPNVRDVRNGAIKFEMLKYNTYQDLVFDLPSALNMKGYSGPYIQYTHARILSVLDKNSFEYDVNLFNYVLAELDTSKLTILEINVLRTLYLFPEVVTKSAKEYAPNELCSFLFELCQRYNHFYSEVPIIKTEDVYLKSLRLLISKSVAMVLNQGLYLLGINAPERM